MPASLPHLRFRPPSRPTFLHCPTIYWRNWYPPLLPKRKGEKKRILQSLDTLLHYPANTHPTAECVGSKRLLYGSRLGIHVFRFRSVTPERMGIMFTWCFLSVVLQNLAVTQATTHSTAEVQWVCSLASHPLDTRVTSHLSRLVSQTSSRSHCDPNPGRETGMKCEMCFWIHIFSAYFLTQTGWRLRRAKENSCQRLWS